MKWKPNIQSPALLLIIAAISVFLAETIIMLFLPLLPPLPAWTAVLIDSTLLALLLFPMLYLFLFRPLWRNINARQQAQAELHKTHAELERHVAQLERHNREAALLHEMANLFQACPGTEEAYHVIIEYTQQLFAEDSGALYVFNSSRNLVEKVAQWGAAPPGEEAFVPEACWALRRGKVHVVNPGRSAIACRHPAQSTSSAYLCVPMMAQGDTLGVLSLYGSSKPNGMAPDRLTESKQQLAVSVAEQVALALANLRLRETLRRQAIRDPLTNLFNRRFMEETLARELDRAKRRETSVAIVMFDLDHFKALNDTFGHDAGDRLLSELGRCVQSCIRGEDVACRHGGEEFTLILPDCQPDEAAKRAAELREHMKQMSVTHNGVLLHNITASFGIALYPQHGETVDALLHIADVALYQAKHQGRDRVVMAETGAESNRLLVH